MSEPAAEAALAEFIRQRTGARRASVLEFQRLSGGAIQDNHALTLSLEGGSNPGRLEVVVRSDAPSRIESSLDRAQEFHVLAAAFEAGVTVPRPLWLCTDTSVSGQVFSVMNRMPGSASPARLLRGAIDPQQARALTRRLGTELARLHTIRPPHADLDFLPVPGDSPARQRLRTYREALARIPDSHPVLEWALNWLEDHVPASSSLALCHCDFRTGNYMVRDGRLTAVLDWEFAAWSDPYEDLGWLCSRSWRFGVPEKEVGGLGDKQDLYAGYTEHSGTAVDPDKVLYWEIMAMVRWAIIAMQQAQRHLSGEQRSLELALTGRMLPEIEFDLLRQVCDMENDDARSAPRP
ncbi:phosphotransferase family protein [Candidimonas nitroreducens]|uniref:Phosphotransferase family protein n=1 Tax=Candidimonas nitroreducens TaxID=683354 RepID=A0A225M2S6_9BURK|nr:phosphotransferase family protein [Candidimonas nitroreducens]OWT55645.1 phosphotransferase family protein [Candidimonas nitroreducens]